MSVTTYRVQSRSTVTCTRSRSHDLPCTRVELSTRIYSLRRVSPPLSRPLSRNKQTSKAHHDPLFSRNVSRMALELEQLDDDEPDEQLDSSKQRTYEMIREAS